MKATTIGVMCAGAFVLANIIGACDRRPVAADGYTFEKAEYLRPAPEITFVTHSNRGDLLRHAPPEVLKAGDGKAREVMAWSVIRGNECTVHIIDAEASYQPEWIGHEVAHCIYGRWHS